MRQRDERSEQDAMPTGGVAVFKAAPSVPCMAKRTCRACEAEQISNHCNARVARRAQIRTFIEHHWLPLQQAWTKVTLRRAEFLWRRPTILVCILGTANCPRGQADAGRAGTCLMSSRRPLPPSGAAVEGATRGPARAAETPFSAVRRGPNRSPDACPPRGVQRSGSAHRLACYGMRSGIAQR